MAESLAQKLNKLKASEMFVPYVQDREFGTYENNLTGQTVNREAELIFAEQNKIRDAINTELVQKHNNSLKPTQETNTGNADYTSNVGDELISKDRGIQYQEIGHTYH